jgi:hypothetical protein
MIELQKSELPYNTEVVMSGFNNKEIKIIKETEKAFFMCYTKIVKRGTSMVSDYEEVTFWCPKSVWYNDSNFRNGGHNHNPKNGSVIFNAPYFIMK